MDTWWLHKLAGPPLKPLTTSGGPELPPFPKKTTFKKKTKFQKPREVFVQNGMKKKNLPCFAQVP